MPRKKKTTETPIALAEPAAEAPEKPGIGKLGEALLETLVETVLPEVVETAVDVIETKIRKRMSGEEAKALLRQQRREIRLKEKGY